MMIATWRKKRTEKKVTKRGFMKKKDMELVIPSQFTCPISLELMKDPVTLSTGITYDRKNIEKWIYEGGNQTCPITNQELKSCNKSGINIIDPVLIPNHNIRKMIQQWCVENKEHGIDRIPTPRIPVSSSDVSELLAKITSTSKLDMQDSGLLCKELVTRVKDLASESDRNKCCFVTEGTEKVLSSAFLELSEGENNAKNVTIMEVILSTLAFFLPLDVKSKTILGSISSLRSIAWFLKNGSLSSRRNGVLVLREILKMEEEDKVEMLLSIEGALEGLVKLVKEPICPNTTKACLLTIYHMVINSSTKSRFVDVGLVELLIEILVDCDKSICEKALGVLDGILSYEEGVKRAYNYALSVPVLVKKLLRVSNLATEFSVSVLWKIICKNEQRENNDEDCCGVLVEALQVGAFQKLLLLLQVGCSETTKDKASELLKLLNVHRDRAECVDSLDFKSLKRTF